MPLLAIVEVEGDDVLIEFGGLGVEATFGRRKPGAALGSSGYAGHRALKPVLRGL